MTNSEKDKRYQFLRLCYSLTMQGFRFDRSKHVKYGLVFERGESKTLFHYKTKTPFVDSMSYDTKTNTHTFGQWADKNKTKQW